MTPVTVAINAQLVRVGSEMVRIYGDETSGWSLDPEDLAPGQPGTYRYGSVEELFFALINLSLSTEAEA